MREKFSGTIRKEPPKRQYFDDSLLSMINCISKYEMDDSGFDNKLMNFKNQRDELNDFKKRDDNDNSELETHHNENGEDDDIN